MNKTTTLHEPETVATLLIKLNGAPASIKFCDIVIEDFERENAENSLGQTDTQELSQAIERWKQIRGIVKRIHASIS
jgi:hypothetical protein